MRLSCEIKTRGMSAMVGEAQGMLHKRIPPPPPGISSCRPPVPRSPPTLPTFPTPSRKSGAADLGRSATDNTAWAFNAADAGRGEGLWVATGSATGSALKAAAASGAAARSGVAGSAGAAPADGEGSRADGGPRAAVGLRPVVGEPEEGGRERRSGGGGGGEVMGGASGGSRDSAGSVGNGGWGSLRDRPAVDGEDSPPASGSEVDMLEFLQEAGERRLREEADEEVRGHLFCCF